ncbi:MAG: RHS repeat domain-containing protein, partial [bacterium]
SVAVSDSMGRPFAVYNESGSWSIIQRGQSGSAQCPVGTAYYSTTSIGGGAETLNCHDQLGRKIRSAVQGFLGDWIFTDSYFDQSGQAERVSEPYFEGGTRYWSTTQYDALGRVIASTAANGLSEEVFFDNQASHCGQSGPRSILIRTDPGDGAVRWQWEYKNVAGETERVVDHDCGEISHTYDAVGNLVETSGIDGSTIDIAYDSLGQYKIQMSDPDKGVWQYANNPLGEVIRQLDSKEQAIDFEYDLSGRVTHRRELRNVQSLNDSSYEIVNHEIRYWQNNAAPGITGLGQVYFEEYLEGEAGPALHSRDYDFDSLGRIEQITHHLESEDFVERATYDEYGRAFQNFDVTGDSRGVRFHYNDHGYLEKLQEAREGFEGVIYQQIEALDQRGNPIAVTLGNQVEAFAEYEASSGYVSMLEAYDSNGQEIQFVEYAFDKLGNLTSRHDRSGSSDKLEEFEYDQLNRLERVLLTAPQFGLSGHVTQDLSYSPDGNIAFKLGVGSYSYGQGTAGPHAVTQAGGVTYTYDANGNQVSSSDGRTITYSVFDKAQRIAKGSEFSEFSYGLGNRRYKRTDDNAVDLIKTTLMIGSVERIEKAGIDPFFKRYIQGIAIVDYYPGSQQSQTSYLTKDHLGSIHSTSNENGHKVDENHFGPWGLRQANDWQSPLPVSSLIATNQFTTRGFTGHEHADGLGVIHMNGRIYDPRLGRFLQADPFVQEPRNGQSLNRYSYALNNPLSYTDPSGYFFKRFIKKWGRVIVAAVAAYYTFGAASAWASSFASASGAAAIGGAAAGFVSVAIQTGGLKGTLKGAIIGAATAYVGHSIRIGYEQWKSGKGELFDLVYANHDTGWEFANITEKTRPSLTRLAVNGQGNSLEYAIERSAERLFGTNPQNYLGESFQLFYNPSHGLIADTIESFLGKLTNTSNLARQLAGYISRNTAVINQINVHSQGAIITTNALRLLENGMLPESVSFNVSGAAVSESLVNRVASRVGITNVVYKARFFDFVPNVLGMTTLNPFRIIGSTLLFPTLFMGPGISQHSIYLP